MKNFEKWEQGENLVQMIDCRLFENQRGEKGG